MEETTFVLGGNTYRATLGGVNGLPPTWVTVTGIDGEGNPTGVEVGFPGS